MSPQQKQLPEERLGQTLQTALVDPSSGAPKDLFKVFSEAVCNGQGPLAPRLFFEAVEQSSMAISITDLESRILYANPAFAEVTGHPPSGVIGQKPSILADESTPDTVYRSLWTRIQQRQTWSGRLLNRRKNGARYLAELTVVPVLDAAGQTTHYLAMHRDVTDLHRLEQQVRNQKALIESVIDAAPLVIAVLDDEGAVVLDNQAYKKLMRDMRGQQPATALLTALRASMGEALDDAREGRRGFAEQVVSYHSRTGQEPRWFSCSGTWFEERDLSADGFFEPRRRTYLLLIADEITALKRRQEETRINALRALAAEEELAASVREVLNGAIFQIQSPLNVIAAAADMLRRRRTGTSEPLRSVLEQALEAGTQALATLKASMPAEIVEPRRSVNLNELLREVLGISTERLLKEGVVVDWQPTSVLPSVLGQERQLRCLFKQLVDNALDAMSGRGCDRRELMLTTRLDRELIQVTVADTGPGIPETLRRRVFEPFFSAKGTHGHHIGMGLAVVQEFVNQHSGTIEIDPDYSAGCCVHVRLPIGRYTGFSEECQE